MAEGAEGFGQGVDQAQPRLREGLAGQVAGQEHAGRGLAMARIADEVLEIQQTTLADVIRRNTSIDAEIPDDVFRVN